MYNVGDLAMLIMDVERTHALFPDATLYVPTQPANWVARFCPAATQVSSSGFYRLSWRRLLPGRIARTFPSLDKWERRWLLRNADSYLRAVAWRNRVREGVNPDTDRELTLLRNTTLVIAAGGGYLNDTFAGPAFRGTKVLLLAQSLGIPTALFGQGLGPIERPDTREVIGTMLSRAHLIGMREGLFGPKLARDLGVSADHLEVTGDGALDLAARQRTTELGSYLGFNLRLANYANTKQADLSEIAQVISEFANGLGISVMPCPISFDERSPDEAAVRSRISPSTQIFPDACPFDPLEVMRRVGRCRVVVTGSYHAAVFALAQGIPVVGLAASQYYSSKFSGVAGLFGAAMTVLELDRPDAAKALAELLAQYWRGAGTLRDACLAAADQQRQSTQRAWSRLPMIASSMPR